MHQDSRRALPPGLLWLTLNRVFAAPRDAGLATFGRNDPCQLKPPVQTHLVGGPR